MAARFGLSTEQSAQIDALLAALEREPDPHTTVSSPAAALNAHIADALVALELPEVRGATRIADIGAGVGFPGLALGMALPAARVSLIEAAGRKADVARRLIDATGLINIDVVHARAEEHAADARGAYDLACARAVGPLPVVLEYAAPLLRVNGAAVLWRGRRDPAEESAGVAASAVLGLEPGDITAVTPFAGARDRHLHVFRSTSAAPARFPRRPGMARKRPLG